MWLEIIRYTVFGVFAASTAIALGSWAVRTRRISPFSKSAHLIRRSTDPVLQPVERILVRRGANPHNAEWWLLGGAVAGGIVVMTAVNFLATQLFFLAQAGGAGPFALVRFLIRTAGQVVTVALFARVIGSWFGITRYNRWMKWAYTLTDWIVEPLRKIIPPIGMIDVTPIVAYLALRYVILPLLYLPLPG